MDHQVTLLTKVRGKDEMSDGRVEWKGRQGQI